MTISIRDPFVYNGVIYVAFFGGLGIYAFLQVVWSFLGYKDKANRHYARKLCFHVLASLFGLFECLYSLSFILNGGYSRWGLIVHLLALYLQVILFALIINFWKLSLNHISPSSVFGILILGINGAVTLLNILALLILDVEDYLDSIFNVIYLVVNSLTLVVLSSSLLLYGHNMKKNLADSTAIMAASRPISISTASSVKVSQASEDHVNLRIKFKMLSRINKILVTVLVCYSLRVMALCFLIVSYAIAGAPMILTVWLVISWLIPSLPILVYLNIMKMSPSISNRGTRAFKFFEDDNITESAMIDDERGYSEDWGSSRIDRSRSDNTFTTSTLNVV